MIAQNLINSANLSGLEFIQLVCEKQGWQLPVKIYSSLSENAEPVDFNPGMQPGILLNSKLAYGYTAADLYHTAELLWYWSNQGGILLGLKRAFRTILKLFTLLVLIYTSAFFVAAASSTFQWNFFQLPQILDNGLVLTACWLLEFVAALSFWLVLMQLSSRVIVFLKANLVNRFADQEILQPYLIQQNIGKVIHVLTFGIVQPVHKPNSV